MEAVAPSGVVMGLPATYVPGRNDSPQRACFAKGHRAPKRTPQASFAPHVGIVEQGGTRFRPTPVAQPEKPTVTRSDVSVPRTSIGDGGEMATRTSYRAPTTTVRQAIPGKGMVAIPAPAPQLPPPVTSKSTDLGGGEAQAPVPFLPTTPMIGLAQDPNPFEPYCGNGIDAASELCRAASDAGLSDYCRQQLLAFLGSKSSQTLGSWIAAQELCDQAALRRAVGIAEASIAAKTSAGLYRASGGVYSPHAFVVYGMPHGGTVYVDNRPVIGRWLDAGLTRWEVALPDANPHYARVVSASGDTRDSSVLDGSTLVFDQMNPAPTVAPTSLTIDGFFSSKPAPQLDKPGFGNPFGVDGYAWKQDRVRKPGPFDYRDNGATMDWRKPSSGMPNYYRASGDATNGLTAAEDAELDRLTGGRQALASDWTHGDAANLGFGGEGGDTYQTPPPVPASPPVDYARLVGSIGQAVGGVFAGINEAVHNAAQDRNRTLEIEYANNARGAALALQRSIAETNQEIQRLAATSTPAANATVTALQQQVADFQRRLNEQPPAPQPSSSGMGGGTIAAIAIGSVAVLGLGAYVALGGGRRR